MSRYAQARTGKGGLEAWSDRLGRRRRLYHLCDSVAIETRDHLIFEYAASGFSRGGSGHNRYV